MDDESTRHGQQEVQEGANARYVGLFWKRLRENSVQHLQGELVRCGRLM